MANEAYKLRGTKQPIAFGVEKLEGYIVDATEDTVEGQELEVENEDGNVVAHFSGFGQRASFLCPTQAHRVREILSKLARSLSSS